MTRIVIVGGLLIVLVGSAARAGLDPALKCETTRLKLAGSYVSCVMKAEAKARKVRVAPDFSACDAVLAKRWDASARRALARESECPSLSGGAASELVLLQDGFNRIKELLEAAIGGLRFVDNGDGTITDHLTGLMWEKKVSCPDLLFWEPGDDGLHCALVFVSSEIATGPWLATVNGLVAEEGGAPGAQAGLGGYSDWRLPTVSELSTLGPVLSGDACGALGTSVCEDPIFGPTAYYDTVSGSVTPTYGVWAVNFQGSPSFTATLVDETESITLLVRAVRTLR